MDKNILRELIECAKAVFVDDPKMQQVCVTQAILESGFQRPQGGSQLATKYKNLFGRKGKGPNGSVNLKTKEELDGDSSNLENVNDYFAVYSSYEESFEDYKKLMYRPRYDRVIKAKTVLEAFDKLYHCGYATDPNYPSKLKAIYHSYVESRFGE